MNKTRAERMLETIRNANRLYFKRTLKRAVYLVHTGPIPSLSSCAPRRVPPCPLHLRARSFILGCRQLFILRRYVPGPLLSTSSASLNPVRLGSGRSIGSANPHGYCLDPVEWPVC